MFRTIISGKGIPVIKNGEILEDNLNKEHVHRGYMSNVFRLYIEIFTELRKQILKRNIGYIIS